MHIKGNNYQNEERGQQNGRKILATYSSDEELIPIKHQKNK
jgi:hypothetical protein